MNKASLLTRTLLLFALIVGSTSVWGQNVTWKRVNASELQSNDIVVIVDRVSSKAMSNNNGTTKAPDAVSVELNEDQTEIVSTVEDNLTWTISLVPLTGSTVTPTGDNCFVKFSNGNDFLYVTKTNNGVRVGKGERSEFLITPGGDNSGYYLYNNDNSDPRYIGCYNQSDWRCYGSINSNIKVNNNAFYKKVETIVDNRENAGLAWSEEAIEIEQGATEYTLPTLSNPNGVTVTYSSDNEEIALVDKTTGEVVLETGEVGTATITATFEGNSNYQPASVSYTINIKKASVAPIGALFWESVSGHESDTGDGTSTIKTSDEGLDSNNWSSFSNVNSGRGGCLKISSSKKAGTAITGEIALTGNGLLTFRVKQYNDSESGSLTISATGANASGDLSVTGTADWVEKTVSLTGGNGEVVITFTGVANKRIYLDDILVVQTTTATITSAGYATFSSDKNVDFFANEGLTVYTAKDNGTSVSLNEVTSKKVPANTAVVLKGEAGDYTGTVVASADALTNNDLKVATEDLNGDGTIYVLNKKDGKVGFYKLSTTGTLSKGKAYLKSEGLAPFLGFDGEDTTGINSVERESLSVEGCYTLDGRRVAQPTKGLYIVNGKKVIIK